ncbi:MAG: oligosaccharide flippase family protein [Acidobacterium ailaaui]|nr:oligosaccharide flippase family protein [Pseudacidobacterium ailaaui]
MKMKKLVKLFDNYWIRSSLLTIMQRLGSVLFGIGSYVILVRILNKESIGIWSLFLGISMTFELTKNALLKNGIITFYNIIENRDEILSSGFVINLIYSLIFVIIILCLGEIISKYLNAPHLYSMLKIYTIGIIFLVYFSHFEYIQQSNLNFTGSFVSYTTRQGIFFLLILITFISGNNTNLNQLVFFQNISIFISVIISFFYTKKYLNFIFNPKLILIKKIFNYGKYIFSSGVLSNIFGNLDRYMIAGLMNNTYVAYYDLSARINNMIDVPTYALADVLFPKSVIAEKEEGRYKVKHLFEMTTAAIISILIPFSILVIIFNKMIIRILAGNNYLLASNIIIISMLYAFLRPIQNQACNVLNSINKPQISFIVNLVFFMLNILLDYIFITKVGYIGAAIGSMVVTIIGANVATFALSKYTKVSIRNILRKTFMIYRHFIIYRRLNIS